MEIHDMNAKSEYFVGACTHVDDTPEILNRSEIDFGAQRRIAWLRDMHKKGARVKVAFIDSDPVGFIHLIPIEVCPWGPLGQDLMVIPCLAVMEKAKHRDVGKILIREAEEEARHKNKKGIMTVGYYHDCWFMPASFFEKCGFQVARRKGEEAILWKVFDSQVKVPSFLERDYHFTPVAGKVVVDLFWNTFCPTSSIEAQRVQEVIGEYRDTVIFHEYCADDRRILLRFQIPRRIFINGKETGWGYEASKDGIREAILQAMRNS